MPATTSAACCGSPGSTPRRTRLAACSTTSTPTAPRFGKSDLDEEMVAHEWLARVFEPVIRAIPDDLQGKLEPAEVFHQLLDHRWYMSQNAGRDIPLAEAVTSYIDNVLRHRRDEATVIDPPTGRDHAADRRSVDDDDWRTKV